MTLLPMTPAHYPDAVWIWNAAIHPHYPINLRFLSYNTIPCTGEAVQGRVAVINHELVGFVLACAMIESSPDSLGWVSALAVHPVAQRQGIGSELLDWATGWLKENGCKRVRFGGNLRPFLPGLPLVGWPSLAFFDRHGFQSRASEPYEYDIARSLKNYHPIYPRPAHVALVPMQRGEEDLLLEFLQREYPGRWEFEAREFIKNGGRRADYLLLRVGSDIQGFCRLTMEDSERPIERFFPQRLKRPWGQFGPLGLSKAVRGQGLGGYLVDAAAVYLQSLGVDGCVIDWTVLVDFYGKFGFSVYNQYKSLFKSL